MEQLIQGIIPLILVALGLIFGRRIEKKHYADIMRRELLQVHRPTTAGKRVMGDDRAVASTELVMGSVAISIDAFKRLLAGLRNIFGGNVQSYETLVDRARREAVLRMLESCAQADQVINIRLETCSIAGGGSERIASVEVLAYGTAVYFAK